MPGNYRYEEELTRGRRGDTSRGFGERAREDDEWQDQNQRFAGSPDYGRDMGGSDFRRERTSGTDYALKTRQCPQVSHT